MPHPIHPIEPQDSPADAAPQSTHLATKQTGSPIRRWLKRAAAALARAEQRITENFRVPPHGG